MKSGTTAMIGFVVLHRLLNNIKNHLEWSSGINDYSGTISTHSNRLLQWHQRVGFSWSVNGMQP